MTSFYFIYMYYFLLLVTYKIVMHVPTDILIFIFFTYIVSIYYICNKIVQINVDNRQKPSDQKVY